MNLAASNIVVTGGAGFLGSHVVERLRMQGCTSIVVPRSTTCDLRVKGNIERLLNESRPDIIFHLAATVGGIGANRAHPAKFFYDNAIMGIELLEQARLAGVRKLVVVGTVCAYPKFTPVPFAEDDLWNGYPEETNAPYGLAKKILLVQAQAYRQQYGFDAIYLLPTNLYGPRDNFDLGSSHVIPALIRKLHAARQLGLEIVTMWGDGTPTREFLHVADAALGLVLAAEHYSGPEPINLGGGEEIAIRDLALMITRLIGYAGRIHWDTSMPSGQPRRKVDSSRAAQLFGFRAEHTLSDGLRETIDWYLHRMALELS